MFWIFLSCQPDARYFQTIDIDENSYQLVAQEIPSLLSPRTMTGELGTITSGGVFSVSFEEVSFDYQYGRSISLQYQVENQVLYPLDRDGLILLSFYAHLDEVRSVLRDTELDVEAIFPVDIAVTPIVPDITLALLPFENAAYVPSAHHFIILSDLTEKEVPIASNKGVVAHEFGHAVFHWLTTGGTTTASWGRTEGEASNSLASLDEGLADVLGALISGQSDFISYSLEGLERDLAGAQTIGDVEILPEDFQAEGVLSLYDPYPLGSVFAATIWDVHQQGVERIQLLNWLFRTTRNFAENNSSEEDLMNKRLGYQWLDEFVQQAEDDSQKGFACQAIQTRFGESVTVSSCL